MGRSVCGGRCEYGLDVVPEIPFGRELRFRGAGAAEAYSNIALGIPCVSSRYSKGAVSLMGHVGRGVVRGEKVAESGL